MTTKIRIDELPEFDLAQHLNTDEDIAEYLSQILEDGEPGELAAALGHIAKARGMTEIARASGIKREALYRALRPEAHPRLDTIQRVCRALGVTLTAKVAEPGESSPAQPVHQ
jgi:probable addiction module antidote protein